MGTPYREPPSALSLSNLSEIGRVEQKIDWMMDGFKDLKGDFDVHEKASNQVHIDMAVLQSKVATISRLVWGIGAFLGGVTTIVVGAWDHQTARPMMTAGLTHSINASIAHEPGEPLCR